MTTPHLEAVFGNPYDPGNPYGYDPVIQADERAEMFDGGELLLDTLGTCAEFVPRTLGGRLDTIDALVTRVRPLFRRDATLGLGYGFASFLAAINVWLGGTEAQRKSLATKLLAGSRISFSQQETPASSEHAPHQVSARRRDGAFFVTGRSTLVVNAACADTAVISARTADLPRSQAHSLLLVDLTALPSQHWRRLPRLHTLGLRGCQLGGLEFNSCPVPADAVIGEVGTGDDLAMRSAQIGGCATMGLALGMLDASLFTVLRFALSRRLYGRTVAEIPHARATMAGAFADLLALDCLVMTAARASHLFPANSVYAAAAKLLVPTLLEDAMNELAVVLGARYYLREGEHAIFGKHFRDLPALCLLHPDRTADEFTLLWHLPALARELQDPSEPPAGVFQHDANVPSLTLEAPRPGGHGDPLLAMLAPYLQELGRETSNSEDVEITTDLLLGELRKLVYHAGEVPTWQVCPAAGPDSGDQAERYAVLLAATACLGVWRHNRHQRVLTDTAWIRAALHRLLGRLVPGLPPCPVRLDEALFSELVTRARTQVGFCLDADQVSRTLP